MLTFFVLSYRSCGIYSVSHGNTMKTSNTPWLLVLLLILSANGCSIIHGTTNSDIPSKDPIEVVKLFFETYGTPRMDEIGPYTSAKFRDDKPRTVWISETWKALKQMEYEKLEIKILDSKIKDKNALVAVQAKIKTVAGEVNQKEIYSLILENNRWLIDDLVVTDEEIDLENMKI